MPTPPSKQPEANSLTALAKRALEEGPLQGRATIESLRAAGPAALAALQELLASPSTPPTQKRHADAVLDAVCAQKDASASGLFWYTDLESARVAARKSNKPILSLRLLGRLDEDLSCANSRFFRTLLYPTPSVSKVLSQRFVLHWQSVRPVPRVTIDFGDGRRLVRTLTGNSAHYVLDPSGRPVDVLPGVYTASEFLGALGSAAEMAMASAHLEGKRRAEMLKQLHQQAQKALLNRWAKELERVGLREAARRALSCLQSGALAIAQETLTTATRDDVWTSLGALHQNQSGLSIESQALIRRKTPSAWQAGRLAMGKARVEDPLLTKMRFLVSTTSEETIRNEFNLHRRVHEQFAQGTPSEDVEALNDWVYESLFLMPLNDPWLGLAPPDSFAALDDEGQIPS